MPQTLELPAIPPATTVAADCEEEFPNRIRWTRDECARLADAGFLVGRYELIDGEIIRKMGQNPPHRISVALVMAWLVGIYNPLGYGIFCVVATCERRGTSATHPIPLPIITIYGFCDEPVKALGKKDDPQTLLSTAEIMTIALVAAEFFYRQSASGSGFSNHPWLHRSLLQKSLQPSVAPHP